MKQEFKSVKIENQIWMAENLNLDTFRNGDPIPHAKTDAEWERAGKSGHPAWCYYKNDHKNGKLYNWHAVNDPRGLAPKGWRVPSYHDFETLMKNVGGSGRNAYQALKGDGSSGFNANFVGWRNCYGDLISVGHSGIWWSSSDQGNCNAWNLIMYSVSQDAYLNSSFMEFGFSVRCLLGIEYDFFGSVPNFTQTTSFEINPQKLYGKWVEGWALDLHSTSSEPIKDSDDNITGWNTIRTPIAEELYRLKYLKQHYLVDNIAIQAADFLNKYKNKWHLDIIIPIPPSDSSRFVQPVYEMAKYIGHYVGLPVELNTLKKDKPTNQLKNIEDTNSRREVFKDVFNIDLDILSGKVVLIFDDIYRSGETLNAVCDVIINKGKAKGVYVLTITKTRSKR
jgi:uncharacterized protein (TIGR02145 family)